MSELDKEWEDWLVENLKIGCDPVELCSIMRESGFDAASLKRMMGDAYPGDAAQGTQSTQQSQQNPVDFAALAATMDVRADKVGAKRFPNDKVQLYTIDNFLTPAECERIIALSEARLHPSEVSHDSGDDAFRTSETGYLDEQVAIEDAAFVLFIEEKIARTLGVRLPFSEPIQTQRYAVGQEFKAHHDFFSPDMGDTYSEFTDDMGQRTWTFMVYLNDTPKGGGTDFPYLKHTFYPQQGQAVIWNNIYADGTPNRYTLHHGMPVEAGKKLIITKWFRERCSDVMFYD